MDGVGCLMRYNGCLGMGWDGMRWMAVGGWRMGGAKVAVRPFWRSFTQESVVTVRQPSFP